MTSIFWDSRAEQITEIRYRDHGGGFYFYFFSFFTRRKERKKGTTGIVTSSSHDYRHCTVSPGLRMTRCFWSAF